ncbi:hypothetical protein FACS189499_09360 [Clostridia bacterium]|nr:hypothetical protein FACS189499_09360 [Clostridia bacterium]
MNGNDNKNLISTNSSIPLEYETQILNSDSHIVNRKRELEYLTDEMYDNFLIFGPSCVGKTQLSKVVAKHFNDNNGLVFWHRVYPQTAEIQAKNFLELFATFVSVKCADNSLQEYLKTHGIYVTNQLCVMIEHILNAHPLSVFIDDMQNITQGNNQLFQLLDIFFSNVSCKVYISGWYIAIPEQYTKKARTMLVEVMPMNAEHICEVAKRVKSDISDDVLMVVIQKSEGLPGIAEIIPYNENWGESDGLTDYFRRLLKSINDEERILLFALAISGKSLVRSRVAEAGFGAAYSTLVNRHIVKEQTKHITLHDKYRESIIKSIDITEPRVISLLELCSSDEPSILLNILDLLCSLDKIEEYALMLRKYFPELLKYQFDVQLLASIQQASPLAGKYTLDFLVAKMVLLERQGQYDTLGMLIDVTQDVITSNHTDYYMWQYVYLRYLYFKCEFTKILDDFYKNQELLSQYPSDVYLQILFIIGRTYFVMGELRPATEIYIYIFNTAISKGLRSLAAKAIHRICIIEEKLGLFKETLKSLVLLNSDKYLISAKRLSFSHYRIAKCHLGFGEFAEASESNNSSIEIKESLNSRRGLLFSHKLNSQIALKEGKTKDAVYWGQLAYAESLQLGVEKEIVATSTTCAKALLENGDIQQAADLLDTAINLSQKLYLLKRLETILQLCKENNLKSLEGGLLQSMPTVEKEVGRLVNRYVREFRYTVEQRQANFSLADSLLKDRKSLSQRLLLIF